MFDLNFSTGATPLGSLTLSGGVLYGMTSAGGANNDGVVFSFKDTNISTTINEPTTNSEIAKIYPNPSNGIFTVESGAMISNIEIINVLGEKIYSSKVNSEKTVIDLNSQPKGIYFYKIIASDGGNSTGKLILW